MAVQVPPYDDYIEVLDMLDEERRVWLDWEDNRFGKRGFAQMIYYTNIGTIAPDNSYLVFTGMGHLWDSYRPPSSLA